MKAWNVSILMLIIFSLFACTDSSSGNTSISPDEDSPVVAGDEDTDSPENETSGPDLSNLPIAPDAPDPATAMTDESYVQEFNHTINELPADTGELVALIFPPDDYPNLPDPTMVGKRGVWHTGTDDSLELLAIDEAYGDISHAVKALGEIYLLSGTSILKLNNDEQVEVFAEIPQGSTAKKLWGDENALFILTDGGVGAYNGSGDVIWETMTKGPDAILLKDETLYLAFENNLTAYDTSAQDTFGDVQWTLDIDVGTPAAILADRVLPQALDLVLVGSKKLAGLNVTENTPTVADVEMFEEARVPIKNALDAVNDSNGGFVVAAQGGAYRIVDEDVGLEYRVYVPERWMPGPKVNAVLTDTSNPMAPIYFATDKGLGSMTREDWSIERKVEGMIERIVLRHDRDGALADSRLTAPGDLSTNIPWDSDNDGGWTCYWVLSECYRYKLTGDPEAKAHFDKSLHRMLSQQTLTGSDHFLARSVIRIDGCRLDDCDDPDDGEWYKSPDGEWWIKADTSNDEVTSHMFMMGEAYDICADEEQKEAIVRHVDAIIGGLVDNGYQLIDPQDGLCTSYGQFDPEYVNEWFAGPFADGGRRSAQMLGALNLAYYLTKKQKYLDAKNELMTEHHYDVNITNIGDETVYPQCAGSGDCDELAFQAFVPLLRYEWDPELRERWMVGWRRLYSHLIDQQDAFWDMANAVFENQSADFFNSKRWYRRYPTDLVRWQIKNEVRQDAMLPPEYYLIRDADANYRIRTDGLIFPSDERPNQRHNGPQFQFNGGWGSLRELDGGDALYPYWLGRYYGFIADP